MIRFLPDTLRDALLRPFAMGAPNSHVYVEIMAPDVRLAAVVLLGITCALWIAWRRPAGRQPALWSLLAWLISAYVAWMATTGNGRYFMPALILVGPLTAGLIAFLPWRKEWKAGSMVLLLAMQALVLFDTDPFDTWALSSWRDAPFYDIAIDREALSEPATYVTVTNISYSLIAPRFNAQSRWMNISSLPRPETGAPDALRAQALLASSSRLKLVVPSRPNYMTAGKQPTAELRETINSMLGSQRLALQEPSDCRLLVSHGLAGELIHERAKLSPQTLEKIGFWVCSLKYPVDSKPGRDPDPQVLRVFEAVERKCPRFFEPGEKSAARFPDAWVRVYPQADMRIYVMDSGEVFYKYFRALNAVSIGTIDTVLHGADTLDCNSIHGRSGLPWERDI